MASEPVNLRREVQKAVKLGRKLLDVDGTWTWKECELFGEMLGVLEEALKQTKKRGRRGK